MLFVFVLAPCAHAENPTKNDAAVVEERNDMLDAASIEVGHSIAQTCTVCHTFDKGGPDQTGPNLFNIVGAKHAREKNYAYSDVLQKMKDRIWTVDALDKWLSLPGAYAPGTKMNFSGLIDPQDRADVIAYLKSLK
ncbi:MAG: c-type cytochrome [Alphaproteobacteria bacterium]|nr:c-type cytochrome [Alphaproteobacteria bacterium]